MAIVRSKVTAQGQVSVPAAVRRKLGVGPGSMLEWADEGDKVIIRRAGRFSSEDIHQAVFGKRLFETKTVDQLKEAIRTYVRKRNARD
ncbi:MAG: AbrB/MazE/SpoVT family DNA-binding domain-containing protein [Bryobacteraceae bacterium]|nr:AbrB/MazE/SpoVT family DNA-binding domain-containing protein [Bryobacteraceae bacterium]